MFSPRGHEAQWRTIYRHLQTMQVGDTVSYRDIRNLVPAAANSSLVPAFHRAVKEMETVHSRSFANVRGIGYRMVQAREHEKLARSQQRGAVRRLTAATRKASSADRSQLTSEERRRLDSMQHHLTMVADAVKRIGRRVDQTEHRVATAEKDVLLTGDRIDRLEDMLRAHGITPTED